MSKSTLEMTHDEWLLDRLKGIGGSDVATILGLNQYKSAYQLWLEKTGQIELTETDSEPAYWGTILEEVVAKEFQERTGKKVRRRNQVFEHSLHPFLRANIDREVVRENAILECKTANQFLAKEWAGDEVPLSYLCQVQHYMNVLNKDYCYIAVLIGGQKFIWKRVERDQELIDVLTEQLVDFWENNVIKGVEPIIDGSKATADFLKDKYSDIEETQTTLPASFDELIDQKNEMKKTKKELDVAIRKIENEIKSELGKRNASIAITKKYIVEWKEIPTKRLNSKKIAEKYPQIAEDEEIYMVTKPRRLIEKEIK
ncbi:YqaJ viral recombinase family protein [Enterococcus faecalis]|uniref:YqaJ viral recombinase family nuclease n=1 Tax=Enterococcus TaxID=1350 RepID=UPI00033111CE|nr:YqaJ viral recombinase family protein [Enterococcus faecalis]EGO8425904.1 endonuclease [Enterococcus faecalis]EGO8429454.1 endonuclease [Enterococcus faecalis]EGO8964997.1 endonuclease [Enterococcus faecalis]EGO9408884.1 endonuclease [Enterococcus faecalis]EGS7981114.1 endonuclease [Enterococcus faecalis]